MASTSNPRKLLARLEARSHPLFESKPRRDNIGTASDARFHSPPRSPSWRRVERALARLREGVRGEAGAARIHSGTPTRSTRDPDAVDTDDIAGALAFAARKPEGRVAISVYLFRNWPSFEEQHRGAMQSWTRQLVSRFCDKAGTEEQAWARRAQQHAQCAEILVRIADSALAEFMRPDHCEACGGHGTTQTGVRVGQSCARCGGRGEAEWSATARLREVRVRKQDWFACWERPYLALLDRLREFERRGAAMHARALA